MEGSSRRAAIIVMGILTLVLAVIAVVIGLRLQEGVGPDDSSASVVVCSCGISAEQSQCATVCASTTARSTSVNPTVTTSTTARSTTVDPTVTTSTTARSTTVSPTTARSTTVVPTTATPTTGTGGGNCNGTVCSSTGNGCIAIHQCDTISNGECTVLYPQVVTGTVDAQQVANNSCKCVQVDVLTGAWDSCGNGHINGHWETLVGASVVCPNNGCGGGGANVGNTIGTNTNATNGEDNNNLVTTSTTVNPPVCGNGIAESGEQCGEPGRSCPAGYSCNNSCGCVKAPAACGNGLAEAGEECGEPGLTCPTGTSCSACGCTADPQCGLACGSSGTCPVGHSCDAGTCKLNYCLQNAGNCVDGSCNPIACGEQCAAGGLCPNGHSCRSNVCVANVCLNGGCSDKCTLDVIPRTALISDDVDRALLALLVIVLGYLMLRFRLVDNLWLETANFFSSERRQRDAKKAFESSFEEEESK